MNCPLFITYISSNSKPYYYWFVLFFQLSFVTSYLDLHLIYGLSNESTEFLRSFKGGMLNSTYRHGQQWLPTSTDNKTQCPSTTHPSVCYESGKNIRLYSIDHFPCKYQNKVKRCVKPNHLGLIFSLLKLVFPFLQQLKTRMNKKDRCLFRFAIHRPMDVRLKNGWTKLESTTIFFNRKRMGPWVSQKMWSGSNVYAPKRVSSSSNCPVKKLIPLSGMLVAYRNGKNLS